MGRRERASIPGTGLRSWLHHVVNADFTLLARPLGQLSLQRRERMMRELTLPSIRRVAANCLQTCTEIIVPFPPLPRKWPHPHHLDGNTAVQGTQAFPPSSVGFVFMQPDGQPHEVRNISRLSHLTRDGGPSEPGVNVMYNIFRESRDERRAVP